MAGLKQIKTKIRAVQKSQQVTKAMEAVSAAKMRKAQSAALSARAYARAAAAILSRVSGSQAMRNNPLVRGAADAALPPSSSDARVSAASTALYVVITSDKGLAGALNSAVLRATYADIQTAGLSKETVSIIAIGRKANDFFTRREFRIEAYHPNTDTLGQEGMDAVVSEAANRFLLGQVDVVKIAYQNFISTFEQRPAVRVLLPLSLPELARIVGDIDAATKIFNPPQEEQPSVYTIEPSEEEVLSAILPKLASIFVYHALLEAQASEHSARMVAMKSASDKAGELTHGLTLKFNKARQAAITREVSEITGGMEAMTM